MDVVVDANILFSVLIKDGGTAKVMFRDELLFSHLNFYSKNFLNINRPSWRKPIVKKRNFKD